MNPNTNNQNSEPLSLKDRIAVGAAGGALAIATGAAAVAGVNALANPDHGTSNQPGNVTVQFHENGTAWDAAKEIKDTDADLRDLAGKIQDQTDAQGDPGVQAGETAILPAADISKQALAEYVVPTTPAAEATPTATPSEVIVDDNDMVTPAPSPEPSEVIVDDNNMVTPAPAERPAPQTEQDSAPQEVVPNDTPVIEQPQEVVPNDTPVIPNPNETSQPDQPQEVVPGGTPVIPNPNQ